MDDNLAGRAKAAIIAATGLAETAVDISIGRRDDRATWRIICAADVTPEQRGAAQAAQAALDAFDADATPVPAISKAQCLLWLLSRGRTEADVDAAIAAIADPIERAAAQIEWRYRQPFRYDHPLMMRLAPALGIDPATLPDAFRAAALL